MRHSSTRPCPASAPAAYAATAGATIPGGKRVCVVKSVGERYLFLPLAHQRELVHQRKAGEPLAGCVAGRFEAPHCCSEQFDGFSVASVFQLQRALEQHAIWRRAHVRRKSVEPASHGGRRGVDDGGGDLGDRRGRLGPRLRCEPMFDLFLAPSSLRERGSEPCVKLPNRFIVKFVMDAFAQELTHKRVK